MFASFYPAFVVIALSSFAIVLLGVSLQDAKEAIDTWRRNIGR